MAVKRKTKSVKMILDAFSNTSNALSVVGLIKQFEAEMNKTTVYRILERLEEEGALHSFVGKDGLKWVAKKVESSEIETDNHPHFQCEECGKSECLPVNYSIPNLPNIKVNAAHLILIGACQECIS